MIYLPLEFWFAKNTNLALPSIWLPYKEQEIFIYFHDSVDDCDTAYKKYKERKQMDELCVLFDKISLPITYETYIANTILDNKNIINNMNDEDKD